MLSVRGCGVVLLGGLGEAVGALQIRKTRQSCSSCYGAGIRSWLSFKLPSSPWSVGREGECPVVLCSHRSQPATGDGLLCSPSNFRSLLIRMKEQVAWHGRGTSKRSL